MLEPFLKWAGGKRWLVQRYADLLPRHFDRYIEPFLGSGAVFFFLSPSVARLADRNGELIEAYRAVRDTPEELERLLSGFQRRHSQRFYYAMRGTIPTDPIERAARFIYLNRTCFNGLFRVNKAGIFNVPVGTKRLVAFPPGYLKRVATALAHAEIEETGFEASLNQATAGDLVYLDPPYTVMHNRNNFIKYNANLFSWEDQMRLAAGVRDASRRGATIVMSNADSAAVKELYRGFGTHHRLLRSSRLAGKPEYRRETTELLITA